ncbi:MAG TPA: hypothetical protein VGZ00_11860 [Candidatus Baltobacteraceae bacterium]|nr:hypothetical protein [Candidatus Baltobacteraceae bacterium]
MSDSPDGTRNNLIKAGAVVAAITVFAAPETASAGVNVFFEVPPVVVGAPGYGYGPGYGPPGPPQCFVPGYGYTPCFDQGYYAAPPVFIGGWGYGGGYYGGYRRGDGGYRGDHGGYRGGYGGYRGGYGGERHGGGEGRRH